MLIETLTQKFLEIQNNLTVKSDEMQAKINENDRELQNQLEETKSQINAVQQVIGMSVSVPNDSIQNETGSTVMTPTTHTTTHASDIARPTMTAISANFQPHNIPSTSTNFQPQYVPSDTTNLQPQNTPSTTTNVQQHYVPQSHHFRKQLVALPKFDGNALIWPTFLADYHRTTSEYNYNSLENTTRLNECLTGKARELVQWLLIHNDMADKVIERLQVRFGRPELLVDAQLSKLNESTMPDWSKQFPLWIRLLISLIAC